uniref:Uncharacterized protein n=1 Tax=Cacopsylla melanoneura TaxID=428564 RepID=A0A8D8R622_9HEMI
MYPQAQRLRAGHQDTNISRKSEHSHLYVYFRDSTAIMFKRYVHYSWSSFIASLGGILSLCMGGASVFTLIEVGLLIFKQCKNWVTNRINTKRTRPKRCHRRVTFSDQKIRY